MTLRFGLIGTGWIGRFHAESLATRLPDATVVAVADPNLGAAQSIGALRAYADPQELIEGPDVTAMHDAVVAGTIGTPQLPRSLTRDPGISAEVAARVKPWTIFNETLIHDFDTLCWLNPGARVTEVYAQAAALVHPQYADAGYLDTAVVQLRFDNGAFGTAEASFQAGKSPSVTGHDARVALEIALTTAESVHTGRPVTLAAVQA